MLAGHSYKDLMDLSTKLLCFIQVILVLLMTTLIDHSGFSIVYSKSYFSQHNFSYEYLMDSALVYNSINYNSPINNAVYNTIEMVQNDHNALYADRAKTFDPRDTTVITMERHGTANGSFPTYSLTVYGNGSVIYKGIKNVATSGIKAYHIHKDRARELIKTFDDLYYFSFKEKYSDSGKASNLPVVTTSINKNGQLKTVVDDHNSYAPLRLRQLEDKIDELTNSKQWLKAQ
jgi:hypothetical protein